MKTGSRFAMFLSLFVLCSCISVSSVRSGPEVYSGVDSRVFQKDGYIDVAMKEVVSPGRVWTWYNSWHIVRRQPGFMGIDTGSGPYTIRDSFNENDFETYTWAHYCYYLYKGEIAEKYSSINYTDKIEDEIKKKRGHIANIIRIDKLDVDLYVITYRRSRSSYKEFHLREVDGYPFFNFPEDQGIAFSDSAISFLAKVKKHHRRDAVYGEETVEIPIGDVILLNPQYFYDPIELENTFIPFDFFNRNLIYEHPEIRAKAQDPVMIRVNKRGVNVYFKKGGSIKQF